MITFANLRTLISQRCL